VMTDVMNPMAVITMVVIRVVPDDLISVAAI
jgi:hypothetical protein